MKVFIATFLILIFAANQSFAAICAEACQLAAAKVKVQVADSLDSSHDCHSKKSDSEDSEPTPAKKNCNTSFCVATTFQVQPLVEQVNEKESIKKILIHGEIISPKFSLFAQNDFFARSRAPARQKIRLHHLLQQFLI